MFLTKSISKCSQRDECYDVDDVDGDVAGGGGGKSCHLFAYR